MDAPTLDRPARDALAEIILAAAAGQEPPEAFESRPPILDTEDRAVRAFRFVPELIFYDLIAERRGDAETWAWLRRVVACLRSDLAVVRVTRSMRHARQRIGQAGLLVIFAGAALAAWLGAWWPFLAGWAAAGAGLVLFMRHYPQPVSDEVKELARWAPFRSELQWRRYSHLVGPRELDMPPGLTPVEEPRERFSLAWFLFGIFFGTLLLPAMLRASPYNVELVESESL